MEDGGLFALASHAVLAQFGQQRIYLLIGLLDVVRLPHGHDDARQRLRILPRGSEAVFIVTGVERVQCALPLGGIFDELDDSIFLVILRIQFSVDGGHALCGGLDRILIDGHVCIRLATRLRAGHLRFDLLRDPLKAVRVGRSQIVFDLNGFAGVNKLLQPDPVVFREITVLASLQERFDLRIQPIQRFNVLGELFGHAGITAFIRRGLEVG